MKPLLEVKPYYQMLREDKTEFKANKSNFKAMENTFNAETFAEALERANEVENVRENNKRSMITALFMVLANELQRLEMKLDEPVEMKVKAWLDANLNEMLAHRMESFTKMVDANLEEELEEKIEDKVDEYLESNLNCRISDWADEWLDDNLEQQIEERAEAYAEKHVDEWIEDSLDEKLEEKADDWIFYNLDEKLEDARDEWLKSNLKGKLEDQILEYLEDNLEDTIDTRVGAWLNENLEKEIKDRADKYAKPVATEPTEQSTTDETESKHILGNEAYEEILRIAELEIRVGEVCTETPIREESGHTIVSCDLVSTCQMMSAVDIARKYNLHTYVTYRDRKEKNLEIHFFKD